MILNIRLRVKEVGICAHMMDIGSRNAEISAELNVDSHLNAIHIHIYY